MAVTSIDVALAAGVSQATVSRVVHGGKNVSAQTRDRVLGAIADVGYSPNLLARAMKTRRTGTIGVVVSHITNPFYPEALQSVGDALAAMGCRMVLWNGEGAGEDAALDAIRQGLVDGVLFTTGTAESKSLREALAAQLPIVLLNRSVADVPGDQVTSDNDAGATLIARHLYELGHRRIGFVGGPSQASTLSERKNSFKRALSKLGAPLLHELMRSGPLSYAHGFASATQLLESRDPPTALFCVNDITALGALDAARAAAVPVPGGLSVVGYDDIQMASWASFDLTTVRQPIVEMSTRAVEYLMERIENPSAPARHERFTANLIVRGTTAPPSSI